MLNWKFKSSEKNNILVLKKITEHNNKIYTFSGISRTGIFNENILNTRIFHKQYFYKQRQPETGKNQAKAKQHPEAELLLFENYLLSSSKLSSKNNRRYSKKCT